jgi:hypothetical protein
VLGKAFTLVPALTIVKSYACFVDPTLSRPHYASPACLGKALGWEEGDPRAQTLYEALDANCDGVFTLGDWMLMAGLLRCVSSCLVLDIVAPLLVINLSLSHTRAQSLV